MKRAIANTLAAGTLLVTGGTAGYVGAEREHGKPPQAEVVCDKAEIIDVTSGQVAYAPIVRTLIGKISLGNIYTVAELSTSPTSDPVTGAAFNTSSRTIIEPGIVPVEISLQDQGNITISIVTSNQEPIGPELAPDSQVAYCPIKQVAVTNNDSPSSNEQ